MNIPLLRVLNQQLLRPQFCDPAELVSWMGGIQAQDLHWMKWALGVRLRSSGIDKIDKALKQGEILRLHIMRPTWHFVAARDIRWMLKLSTERIERAYLSYARSCGLNLPAELPGKGCALLEKILAGHKNLTVAEIIEEFARTGFSFDKQTVRILLAVAEARGVICSGGMRAGRCIYALMEERVAPTPNIDRDEALARLERSYFRSRSPVVRSDFVWWSGLTQREVRRAVGISGSELSAERHNGQEWYVHRACRTRGNLSAASCLLPPYDEYLLGYKDRTEVLPKEHYHRAFTSYGIFYPVILHRGRIIGNWNKKAKCGKFQLESELFAAENDFDFHTAAAGYLKFEYWNHYRPHAGLGGKMVKPYPQDMNAPVREVSFLGGLLHGYRREPMAA